MTAETDLLPLPPLAECSDDSVQEWCRANVEARTEALRAEVDRLKELVRRVGYETLTRAEQAEARAERLEEALREATAMLLADYPETAKRLRALLHK